MSDHRTGALVYEDLVVAVGSTNRAKVAATESALSVLLPRSSLGTRWATFVVRGVAGVASSVSDQPMSDDETMRGAQNRARRALEAVDGAHIGVGIEGGVQQIGGMWFESGWVAVVDRTGRMGLGTSARYQLPDAVMAELLGDGGRELADVMDAMTGSDGVRHGAGAMGVLTNGVLNRDECYRHGLFFAFAPWLAEANSSFDLSRTGRCRDDIGGGGER